MKMRLLCVAALVFRGSPEIYWLLSADGVLA